MSLPCKKAYQLIWQSRDWNIHPILSCLIWVAFCSMYRIRPYRIRFIFRSAEVMSRGVPLAVWQCRGLILIRPVSDRDWATLCFVNRVRNQTTVRAILPRYRSILLYWRRTSYWPSALCKGRCSSGPCILYSGHWAQLGKSGTDANSFIWHWLC